MSSEARLIAVRDRNGLLVRRICRELADHLEESRLVQRVGGHRLRYLRADIVWREPDRIMPQIEAARRTATDKLIRASLRALDNRKVTAGPLKQYPEALLCNIGDEDRVLMQTLVQARAVAERRGRLQAEHDTIAN